MVEKGEMIAESRHIGFSTLFFCGRSCIVLAHMAITQAAKKAIRSSARKRVFNLRRTRAMKAVIKSVRDLATGGKVDEAKSALPQAYKAIDKAAKRGIIKSNAASRTKSRLARLLTRSASAGATAK